MRNNRLILSASVLLQLVFVSLLNAQLVVHYALDDPDNTAPFETMGGTPSAIAGTTTSTVGAVGSALDFSANPGRAYASNSATLNTIGDISANSGLSVSFWVNDSSGGSFERIISMDDGRILEFYTGTSFGVYSTIGFRIDANHAAVSGTIGHHATDILFDGTWHLITLSVDFSGSTGNVQAYLDGELWASQSASFSVSFNDSDEFLGVATRAWGGNQRGEGFQGQLDDVAIWNNPLSASEIKSIYSLANAPFDLNAQQAQELWTLFAAGSGSSGVVGGQAWTYVSGLSGAPGSMDASGQAIILDGNGNGMTVNPQNAWNSPFVLGPQASSFVNEPVLVNGVDTGYVWGQVDPEDLGSLAVTYDNAGMRSLSSLPAAGAHPRILFTSADLPDIRSRLQNTKVGQHMYNCILGWTEELKGTYDNNAAYALPDRFQGSFQTHGFIPRFRAGSLQQGLVYSNYAAGITQMNVSGIDILWGLFSMEAFRCLVDEDEVAGQLLGQAIETAIVDYIQGTGADKYTGLDNHLFNVAYTYDLAYSWLSENARVLLHDYLVEKTRSNDHYGALEVAEITTSNWSTFTYGLTGLLAVEGESGFNDLRYLGYLRSYRNFFTYGWYQSGACFEGMGKNQLGGDALLMFALRGEDVPSHPHLLAYMKNRLPKDILPGSDQFIAYGRWGGYRAPRPIDAMAMKYLYPDDPEINWVYRRAIGSDPDPSDPQRVDWLESIGGGRPDFYWNEPLLTAIMADDPKSPELTRAELDVEKTFFCGERNLLITRSDWSDDALYLNFQARPVNGGHVFADRNTFALTGKGENWFIKRPIAYDNVQNSVVVIDGLLQSRYTPARVVEFVDEPLASFVVGDAKYTWDWDIGTRDVWQNSFGISPPTFDIHLPSGGEWERFWETSNDFSYDQMDTVAMLNIPLYEMPIWFAKQVDEWRMYARRPLLPVEKAFRTAGLVRGEGGSPAYVLVSDDIKVDTAVHNYEWISQLEDGTLIWKVEESNATSARPNGVFTRDVYLFHPTSETQTQPDVGQAALLVRFVEMDLGASTTFDDSVALVDAANDPDDANYLERQLIVSTDAVSPLFKVLLYPFYVGQDPLPETQWVGNALEIRWPGVSHVDRMTTSVAASGKEDLVISRDALELVAMDELVAPSPDRTPDYTPDPTGLPSALEEWDFSTDTGLIFTNGQYDAADAKVDNGTLWFDGSGHQMVSLPALQLPSSNQFSVSFWVNTDKGGNAICEIISDSYKTWSFGLGYWNEVRLKVPDGINTAPRWTEEEIDDVFINNWAHVVLSKDGNQWIAYVNGEPRIVSLGTADIPSNLLQIDFGNAFGNVFYGMQGRIDDLKVFDEALSLQDVLTLLTL